MRIKRTRFRKSWLDFLRAASDSRFVASRMQLDKFAGSIGNLRSLDVPYRRQAPSNNIGLAGGYAQSSGRRTPLPYGFFPDQKDWNDPIQWCDPAGYPRNLWYTGGGRGNLRIIQTPTEVLQFFERDHIWRDLWTDGRKLPEDPEPRWFGYSTAHWEGHTFVV